MWEYVETEHGPLSTESLFQGHLLQFIDRLRSFKATQPRDHIFALVGLCTKLVLGTIDPAKKPPLLEADYTRPLSDLLREAAIHVLLQDQTFSYFDVLNDANGKSSTTDQPPTWVPRWDKEKDLLQAVSPLASTFSACGQRKKTSIRNILMSEKWRDKNGFPLNGSLVDAVSNLWKADAIGDQHAPYEDCLTSISECHKALPEGEASLNTLASTLIASIDHHRQHIDSAVARERFRSWLTYLEKKKKRPPQLLVLDSRFLTSNETENDAHYDLALLQACNNRSVLLTRDGRFGLGPRGMIKGDALLILWGCRWPVVVRPTENRFQGIVIGPLYFHGIMHGEAVAAHEAFRAKEERFYLR